MFREKLEQEFAARRARNARYSIRAFAASLGAEHSTLAQILRGTRRIPAASIRSWAKAMGMERGRGGRLHRRAGEAGTCPDTRAIARESGVLVDQVNDPQGMSFGVWRSRRPSQ